MRWVGVVLAMGLALWHTLMGLGVLGQGLWDVGIWGGLVAPMPMTYADQVLVERALYSGLALGTLEILGALARGVAAALVLVGVGAAVGSGRITAGRAALAAAVLCHLVHAGLAGMAALWAWGVDDHVFLVTWVGERGFYSLEAWVGFRLWGALALSVVAVVVDAALSAGIAALIARGPADG